MLEHVSTEKKKDASKHWPHAFDLFGPEGDWEMI